MATLCSMYIYVCTSTMKPCTGLSNIRRCALNTAPTYSLRDFDGDRIENGCHLSLAFVCVYVSVGAHIPTRRDATEVALQTILRKTDTEAINTKGQVDTLLKETFGSKNVATTCSTLEPNLTLPCPKDVHEWTMDPDSMVNVSTNLQYLLHIYSHVVGLIYQNSTNENLMGWLDLLEMIYHQLSNQMQRYLQAYNLSGNTYCIDYQRITVTITTMQQQECTTMEITNVILRHLRDIARHTISTVGVEDGYTFCPSVSYIPC